MVKNKVLVIVGPTASGKSSFGVSIAKMLNGEIISGDSVQVYEGFNIGSAKIKENEKDNIEHYLIDILKPNGSYSVKDFQEMGRKYIKEITDKNKLPIVVGGTGLYIKALLYDYVFFDEDTKDNDYAELTNEEIYNILQKEDPSSLEKIHINNRKRLIRALNVLRKHGKGMAEIRANQKHEILYDAKIIGLTKDREELIRSINLRVDEMIKDGLVDEIKDLLKRGSKFSDQAMQAIGYKEFKDYFENKKTIDECVEEIKKNTRHLAKRQYTWFKNQMPIEWYDNNEDAIKSIMDWYE